MSQSETREGSPNPLDEVLAKIAKNYEVDSASIAEEFEALGMCIVTAPHSYGKTSFLIPRVQANLNELGYSTRRIVAFGGADVLRKIGELSETDKGVLLIDRAYTVSTKGKGVEETTAVMQAATAKKYKVIPFIAHDVEDRIGRDWDVNTWDLASEGIIDEEPSIINLSLKRLSQELALQYIDALNIREKLPTEVIDYIKAVIPPYLRAIEGTMGRVIEGYSDSVWGVQRIILGHQTDFRRILPSDEYQLLVERVKRDYYKKEEK